MKDFTLVICWLGVVQSALLGIFFLSRSRGNRSLLILGLVLLMTSLRVAKSTIYLFSEAPDLVIINVGFAAHACMAPLLFFYVRSINENFKWDLLSYAQLLPALTIVLLSSLLQVNGFWYAGGYSALLYYTLIYLGATWWYYLRSIKPLTFKPVIFLLLAFSVFQLAYFSNYILRITDYSTAPMLHAILVFAITFLVLQDNSVFNFTKKRKYTNLNLSESDVVRHSQKITEIMAGQKPYLQTDFSLSTLSDLTGLPSHILSYVFNEGMKQSFLQFVNSYRVEDAKKMLLDPTKNHLSIAGIAFDSGFNTLSSFNQAFKKATGTTPSEWKKRNEVVIGG